MTSIAGRLGRWLARWLAHALTVVIALVLAWPAPARADEPALPASAASALPEVRQLLVLLPLPAAHFRPDVSYGGGYSDGVGRESRRALARELARTHGLDIVSDWPLPSLRVDCYVLAVPEGLPIEPIAQAIASDARVAWVQPMNLFRAQQPATPAEPMYPLQPAAAAWQLADLHRVTRGRGVRIAVIDSAVDAAHPDLAGQVALREDFVDGHQAAAAERHGTAVAGVIAARDDNGAGAVGIAPLSRLLALRGCWQGADEQTLCSSLSLARALQFAIDRDAGVINLSLAGPHDRLLARLVDAAIGRGIVVVAAYDATLPSGGFPASQAGVVAVADAPAPGAVMAPGRDVPAPVPPARWTLVSGASYSAAHVSGLFALLRERGASGSALVLRAGGGVDACATLRRAAGGEFLECAPGPAPHASVGR